jgi:hypothetical protein
MGWVMSAQTADALWKRLAQEPGGTSLPLRPNGTPILLLGRPVRIDDTVEGLSHETLAEDDEWNFG